MKIVKKGWPEGWPFFVGLFKVFLLYFSLMGMKVLAKNKKAYFDYEVLEKYEAGMILTGAEVKSVKGCHVQLKGSYVTILGGRPVAENLHVSPYRYAPAAAFNPLRRRQLLLKKKEIDYLAGMTTRKGFTLIPLEIIEKNHLIKMVLGVCRGKKQHDKRDTLKRRAVAREIEQGLKRFSR